MNLLSKIAWRLAWAFRSRRAKGLDVGMPIPDFRLQDVSGGTHRLSALAGKPTVLWFTNLCEDCRSKAPLLNDLLKRAGGRAAVLAVSILAPDDPLPARFAPSCRFPILIDPEDIVEKRLGLAHPAGTCPINNLFIVDGRGKVSFRSHLSALSEAKFRDVCAQHVGV